eukprot:UN31466
MQKLIELLKKIPVADMFDCVQGRKKNYFIINNLKTSATQLLERDTERLGSLRTTINYEDEKQAFGNCELLDDYYKNMKDILMTKRDENKTCPVELQSKLYLIWKFYEYTTSHQP